MNLNENKPTISLSELELVAFTGLVYDRLPKIPEGGSAVYFPDPKIQSRFGLQQQYTLEEMNYGLESLRKRNLVHQSLSQIIPDDLLSGLVSAVILNKPNEDQQYYEKHFGITVGFAHTDDEQYVFTLISQAKPKPFFPTLIAVGAIALIVCFNIISAVVNHYQIQLRPAPFPTATIDNEVNLEALGNNRLAYIKDGDLYLVDKDGVEQITSDHTVSNIKVSHDGKYLGWIEKKDFTIEDKTFKGAGYAISYINLSTLETTYDAIGPLSFVSNGDIYRKEILGFDFVNTDTLSIVYTNDGVWKKEFSTNKSEKLLANNYGKDDSPLDDSRYTSVNIGPNLDKLSIRSSFWEGCRAIFYDLGIRSKTNVLDNRCDGTWSSDGKLYWNYSATGMDEGGLWQLDTSTGKMLKKIYDPNPSIKVSVHDFDTDDNDMIAIIEPETKNNNLISQEKALYQIEDPNNPKLKLIKTLSGSTGNIKLISNRVSYLESSNLRLINLDGQNDQMIVEGISEYVWIPTEQVTTDSSTKTTIKPNTYTSNNLGIKFSYLSKPPTNKNGIKVEEIGNKIYLYGLGEKPESGQYVEVFKKEENVDFESAVRKQILTGYSDGDCKLQIENGTEFSANYQQEYKVATWIYSDKLMDSDPSISDNQDKCPSPYVSYGGRAFFLYDEKHPESFLFFSIGQYGIEAENGKMWEETIEFVN